MKDLKKIVIEVRKVLTQTIEIDQLNGYKLPRNSSDLIDLNREIENRPSTFVRDGAWTEENIEVLSVDFIDAD